MAAILALLYPIIYFVRKSRESMHQSYEASKSASYDIQRVVENLFLIKLLKKVSKILNLGHSGFYMKTEDRYFN